MFHTLHVECLACSLAPSNQACLQRDVYYEYHNKGDCVMNFNELFINIVKGVYYQL